MISFEDNWRPMYINGVLHQVTKSRVPDIYPDFDGVFFADSEYLPQRRCSQHQLRRGATAHLEQGGRIKTSGNWYSLAPNPEN